MILYSTTRKASLSNEYNKLQSYLFKDPVRWGVNVTHATTWNTNQGFKDPVRWGVNVTAENKVAP